MSSNRKNEIIQERFEIVTSSISDLATDVFGEKSSDVSFKQVGRFEYDIDVVVPFNDQVKTFKTGLEKLFTDVVVRYSYTPKGATTTKLYINGNIGEMAMDVQEFNT